MVDEINPPKKTKIDYIHSIAKASVGAVPTVGSFLSEFVESIIMPPYERRKEEWMKNVVQRIQDIQSKIGDLNNLSANEAFQDVLYMTTKTAMSTSSKEKHEKLLNALENTALEISQDQTVNSIFLNYIDIFTEAHLQICAILESPSNYREKRATFAVKETLIEIIKKTIPQLNDELIEVIINDLHKYKLTKIEPHNFSDTPGITDSSTGQDNTKKSYLTEFGNKFLQYIKKKDA